MVFNRNLLDVARINECLTWSEKEWPEGRSFKDVGVV